MYLQKTFRHTGRLWGFGIISIAIVLLNSDAHNNNNNLPKFIALLKTCSSHGQSRCRLHSLSKYLKKISRTSNLAPLAVFIDCQQIDYLQHVSTKKKKLFLKGFTTSGFLTKIPFLFPCEQAISGITCQGRFVFGWRRIVCSPKQKLGRQLNNSGIT